METNLKVLLVDGGGRGHALAWKLNQSPRMGTLFVAPGNGGTQKIAHNVPIKVTDIDALLAFAEKEDIDFTVVGQDDSLALGIVDAFQAKGRRIFGPTKAAAQIESSKVFSKELMAECGIPTAQHVTFIDHGKALAYLDHLYRNGDRHVVIKASGLALGKGSYVCASYGEARQAIEEIMVKRLHGSAGDNVIIEAFVEGQEVSIHAFCDGNTFSLFPTAQDHKQVRNGDSGPNTGGMGTIAPVPWFQPYGFVKKAVVGPALAGLQEKGTPFVGLLYPGLKLKVDSETGEVLEFNARPGDPETQVYMRLLQTDLLDILEACVDGRLHKMDIKWRPGFAACIVVVSGGYPGSYKKNFPITGIETAEAHQGVFVFHAGTKYDGGQLVTDGGRVLGVTAYSERSLADALVRAYEAVQCIHFEGMHYRTDIGQKSLAVM